MSVEIHPTAIVAKGAELADGVSVGPFCVVGPEVTLADGVTLHSHVVVTGRTSIGARTKVFPFASLGHQPQDLKYAGEPADLTIGSDCLIREGVTMNPGTSGGDDPGGSYDPGYGGYDPGYGSGGTSSGDDSSPYGNPDFS